MKTNHLLNALVLFATLLLGCSAKETPVLAVPDGAQAGELTGLKDCEFQIRSYIPAVRKNGQWVIDALHPVVLGQPRLPPVLLTQPAPLG